MSRLRRSDSTSSMDSEDSQFIPRRGRLLDQRNPVPSLYRPKWRRRPLLDRGFFRPLGVDEEFLTFDVQLKDLPDAKTFRKYVQLPRHSTQDAVTAYLEKPPCGCRDIERRNIVDCTYRTDGNGSRTILQLGSDQDPRSFRWM